jgi:hypothetical protein
MLRQGYDPFENFQPMSSHECSKSSPAKYYSHTITIFRVNEIFVSEFEKSGNTWCQNLIAGILHNLDLDNVPDSSRN